MHWTKHENEGAVGFAVTLAVAHTNDICDADNSDVNPTRRLLWAPLCPPLPSLPKWPAVHRTKHENEGAVGFAVPLAVAHTNDICDADNSDVNPTRRLLWAPLCPPLPSLPKWPAVHRTKHENEGAVGFAVPLAVAHTNDICDADNSDVNPTCRLLWAPLRPTLPSLPKWPAAHWTKHENEGAVGFAVTLALAHTNDICDADNSDLGSCQNPVADLKVLDPILWSNHNYSTPLQPNHRRHTFTTAAAVCLGCGLSLNITCETCILHWALRVTCTIEMFVTPSSTHVVLFIH